jgi:hypothetical protein
VFWLSSIKLRLADRLSGFSKREWNMALSCGIAEAIERAMVLDRPFTDME